MSRDNTNSAKTGRGKVILAVYKLLILTIREVCEGEWRETLDLELTVWNKELKSLLTK